MNRCLHLWISRIPFCRAAQPKASQECNRAQKKRVQGNDEKSLHDFRIKTKRKLEHEVATAVIGHALPRSRMGEESFSPKSICESHAIIGMTWGVVKARNLLVTFVIEAFSPPHRQGTILRVAPRCHNEV